MSDEAREAAWSAHCVDMAEGRKRSTTSAAFDAGFEAGQASRPVSDAEVEAAAHAYWLASTTDAEGDLPDFDWEPDEREQFMWAARIVLEAARRVPVPKEES